MAFEGIVGEIIDGVPESEKIQYEWKIANFRSLMQEALDNPRYHSPAFDCWGNSFYLRIYPNAGEEEDEDSGEWISLYLILRKKCPSIKVEFECAIKTYFGKIKNKLLIENTFARKGDGWGWPQFLRQDALRGRRNAWLPSGVLTIVVTMNLKTSTFQTKISTEDVHVHTYLDYSKYSHPQEERQQVKAVTCNKSVQTDFENNICEDTKDVNPEKAGSEKVLQDIVKAWQSGDNCDCLILVRGEEFRAHRFILGARSPVLLAMFRHGDTTEGRSGEVKIDDCEPEVFRDFLNYIYTGEESPLSSKNAVALYAVADKYMAEDLKGRCLERVRSGLGVDTFCETVALALKYGENELLQHATDFASENIRQIVKSVEWQQFIQDEPVTANEILIKALGS